MAAAAATFSESTPADIGIRSLRSHLLSAAADSPGPSLPSTTATRSFGPNSAAPTSTASTAGVIAANVKPSSRNSSSAPGQSEARA